MHHDAGIRWHAVSFQLIDYTTISCPVYYERRLNYRGTHELEELIGVKSHVPKPFLFATGSLRNQTCVHSAGRDPKHKNHHTDRFHLHPFSSRYFSCGALRPTAMRQLL